jgi:hypothetical protein
MTDDWVGIDIHLHKDRMIRLWSDIQYVYFANAGLEYNRDWKWESDTCIDSIFFKDKNEAIMFKLKFGV